MAGLIDPQAELDERFGDYAKTLSIRFCSLLPIVFGDELDRVTLWDRIGSAIQTAYAKTASADVDLFVSLVLEHIKASPSRVAATVEFDEFLERINRLEIEEKQAWLTYMSTHLIPVLVHARREWKLSIAKTGGDA